MNCECPFAIALDAAESLVGRIELLGDESVKTLAGIALTRTVYNEIRSRITCDGETKSPNTGQVECSLQGLTMLTRSIAFGPWTQAQFTVPLNGSNGHMSQLNNPSGNNGHGQYL